MRLAYLGASMVCIALVAASKRSANSPVVIPNANVESAGTLHDGTLDIGLEATIAAWRANGEARPAVGIESFVDFTNPNVALSPGPLVRVPRGTQVRWSIRNSLERPITFYVTATLHGVAGWDSVVVAPGEVSHMTSLASVPGNFGYRARIPNTPARALSTGLMAGAVVVDTVGAPAHANDRVFVMTQADVVMPSLAKGDITLPDKRTLFLINGQSWPNTERLQATVGDTLHWRIINASGDTHPMHLHGFFFRVDENTPESKDLTARGAPGRIEVTERMLPFNGMSMTWSPDRAGNWAFHCHTAMHIMPDLIALREGDPAMTGMGGLMLGISVAPSLQRLTVAQAGATNAAKHAPTRSIRMVAVADADVPKNTLSMRFVVEDRGRKQQSSRGISPTLDLIRGEPVAITIVNHLAEPTSVHWHGIELESFYDGVADWSGSAGHLAPMIAAGDSFVVHFTPPRSGTYMYHSHLREIWQQAAGLDGAIVVRAAAEKPSSEDHVFLLKPPHTDVDGLEINGKVNPDTVVFHLGRPARLRLLSLASANANATMSLTARADSTFANRPDSSLVVWTPIAKDGADLRPADRNQRIARQNVSAGETYDFEYMPTKRGVLHLEVRSGGNDGSLLVRVPIVVR